MPAVMQLATLILLAAVVSSSTAKKDIPICSADKSCFISPADCEFADCEFILSIGKDTTEIYSKGVRWDDFFIVQTERAGLLDERLFTCFGKNPYCYHGFDKNIPNVPYTVDPTSPVMAKLTIISAADDEYLYELPGGTIPYTPKLKYFVRSGNAGIHSKPVIRTELHLLKDATKQLDLNEELNSYILHHNDESSNTVRDDRFKRIAMPHNTVSFDEVLEDSFGQAVPV